MSNYIKPEVLPVWVTWYCILLYVLIGNAIVPLRIHMFTNIAYLYCWYIFVDRSTSIHMYLFVRSRRHSIIQSKVRHTPSNLKSRIKWPNNFCLKINKRNKITNEFFCSIQTRSSKLQTQPFAGWTEWQSILTSEVDDNVGWFNIWPSSISCYSGLICQIRLE